MRLRLFVFTLFLSTSGWGAGAAAAAPAPLKATAKASTRVSASPAATATVATASMTTCTDYAKWVPNMPAPVCQAAELRDSGARSVLGRVIWRRDIEAKDKGLQAPLRILVLGGIHGDEMSSVSTSFRWIQLASQGGGDAARMEWRFIPALNPDGLFAKPAKRVNANGVDLNRNFPTPNWSRDAKIYWEKRTRRDPRRWPGRTALSEPESRYLHAQMDAFKPQLIVSIHAPFGLLDYDGPSAPPQKLGRLYLDQVGIYPGSLGNYGGIHKGVPVVTIELPNATRSPLDADVRLMWDDLLRWIGQRLVPSGMVEADPQTPNAPPSEAAKPSAASTTDPTTAPVAAPLAPPIAALDLPD